MNENNSEIVFKKTMDYIIELEKNYSSKRISDYIIYDKINKFKRVKYKEKCDGYINGKIDDILNLNNMLDNENARIKKEYGILIENNFTNFFTDKNICYKTILELARIKAFEESHEEIGISTLEEWNSVASNDKNYHPQKDRVHDECYRVNRVLHNIDDKILSSLLKEVGINSYTLSKIKHKKDDMPLDLYSKTDVLFLLECLYDCIGGDGKHWKGNEEESYGRSFLTRGKGLLLYRLRMCLTRKFNKFLYLDAEFRQLMGTLFVLPNSIVYDVVWETNSHKYLCNIFYWLIARENVVDYIRDYTNEYTYYKELREMKNYEETAYSIVDDVYWHLQCRRLNDFCIGLDACYTTIERLDKYPQNADILETICIDFFGCRRRDEECIKDIIYKYANRFTDNEKDSIRKSINRNKKYFKKILKFYIQGQRIYRNHACFKDDFLQCAFLNADENEQYQKRYIRGVYIKAVLALLFMATGSNKMFSTPKSDLGKETKISIRNILDEYDEEKDDCYKKNEVYYLPWNFMNEILEWGFLGAKTINDFRINYMIPYYSNKEIGLIDKDNSDDTNSISMDKMRKELLYNCEEEVKNMCKNAMFNSYEMEESIKYELGEF